MMTMTMMMIMALFMIMILMVYDIQVHIFICLFYFWVTLLSKLHSFEAWYDAYLWTVSSIQVMIWRFFGAKP